MEQPLPKHGACNLCSINLSEYVLNPFTQHAIIDYDTLAQDIFYIVEAMDDIIDENLNNHALEAQKTMAMKYRNIGIGIMGLADMFIKLGIVYGSKESVLLINDLMPFIFTESLMASSELAKIRGNFPGYNKAVWDATIIKQNVPKEILEILKKDNCLRNCSLLSIAPTGSIGTMLGISTGMEPHFALSYERKTISLNKEEKIYKINVKVLDEYEKIKSTLSEEEKQRIEQTFVTADSISWLDRITIQAAIQNSVDTGISSTINLPKTITLHEVELIYVKAWELGLKGLTIFREGSRSPILTKSFNEDNNIQNNNAEKRPKTLLAQLHNINIIGKTYIVLVGILHDKPYEIFTFLKPKEIKINNHTGKIIKVAKNHYMFKSEEILLDNIQDNYDGIDKKAITLLVSMLLRHNADIKFIIKTIKKVDENITSFVSAICRILAKYVTKEEISNSVCPECGNKLINEGGCIHCTNCLYSKCE